MVSILMGRKKASWLQRIRVTKTGALLRVANITLKCIRSLKEDWHHRSSTASEFVFLDPTTPLAKLGRSV